MSSFDIALKHNHNDEESFNTVMNLGEELILPATNHITMAYMFFKDNVKINQINPQNILTNIMFVGIDLSYDDDEQQIFDTINSLGVRLTTAELLKNYFFGVKRAMVVPGSHAVRNQAIAEGLDKILTEAGVDFREPGCSMCLAMNPDKLAPGERAASTSNRNFEGRQGRGGRTHLVSPAVAAATAVAGHLATPGDLS